MAVNRKRARRRFTAEHAGPNLSHPIRVDDRARASSQFITVDDGLELMGELATAILADLRARAPTEPETPPAGDS